MENKDLYQKWKASAKYSNEFTSKQQEEIKLQESTDKFFAASEQVVSKDPPKEKLDDLYRRQFTMDVKTPGILVVVIYRNIEPIC